MITVLKLGHLQETDDNFLENFISTAILTFLHDDLNSFLFEKNPTINNKLHT